GCGVTGTFLHCCWECIMVQPLWKTFWQFFTKPNMFLSYDPAITFLAIIQRIIKLMFTQKPAHNVYSSFIHNLLSSIAKLWKEAKCPLTAEWIKKIHTHTHTHTHTMKYYSAIKKNEILPFATTWMELECIMLSEIRQSEKEIYDFTRGI
ncbi:LORF2 protein, partial [Crocuta crocuta]